MLKLEDLQLKSPVKLKINVKYVLPEDEQKKLKEEVEKTLGEEDKGKEICTMGKEDALQFRGCPIIRYFAKNGAYFWL